jgi:microtubule-associated protein-like 6
MHHEQAAHMLTHTLPATATAGHSATVKQVDWSSCSSILQSACAAGELLYWNARSGKQINMPQRDTTFATWTCQLGFPVMGIWPPCTDGTDINSVDRSPDGQLLVTADDSGLVKLFNYPCVVEDAPHRAYRGHSSHVMGLRFAADGKTVCSVGGKDFAMFQFRVVPV